MLPLQEETSLELMTRCRACNINLCKPCARSIRKRLQVVFHVGFVDVLLIASCKANLQFVLEQKQRKELVTIIGFSMVAVLGVFAFLSLTDFPAPPKPSAFGDFL